MSDKVPVFLTWAVATALEDRAREPMIRILPNLEPTGTSAKGVWYRASAETIRALYSLLMEARSYKSSLRGSTKHACHIAAKRLPKESRVDG